MSLPVHGPGRRAACGGLAVTETTIERARTGDEQAFRALTDPHRRELQVHCYRILGSVQDAEDLVQETLLAAWRGLAEFEGRSSLRSWLYRIATNVCLDAQRGRQRRARPMELGSASPPDAAHLGAMLPEHRWVSPIADARVVADDGDPAEVAMARETIRLAFVTALQHLPSRQRAVLILCDVLRWQASEVAALLDTSVAAVNSARQRARATLAAVQAADATSGSGARSDSDSGSGSAVGDAAQQDLLAQYVDAFERYDVARLVTLLRDDATQTMPPYAMWIQGAANVGRWLLGPGIGCRGSRLLPTAANGCPAFGQYRVDVDGGHRPWALQVIELSGDRISALHSFLDTNLFAAFGLPDRLP